MSKEITMPQFSQTTDEVRFIKWLVKVGQDVKKGQALCEVETDKTNVELESFEDGLVLRLLAEPGEIILTNQVVVILGEKDEKISGDRHKDKTLNKDEKKQEDKPGQDAAKLGFTKERGLLGENNQSNQGTFINEEYRASNIVKNIAKIKNIDLRFVKGSGPRKIITMDDLDKFLKEGSRPEISDEYVLSKNQLAVARNLTASKSQIPHFYIKTNICADAVLKWRENNLISPNLNLSSQDKASKISMYAILAFAAADALKKFPKFNGYFKEDKIVLRKDIGIGFAVAEGEELFVPVVKNAGSKSILEIDNEIKSLIAKARRQRFTEGDLSGGTFTISNLGMYGVDEFCAIINPPQAGILAVGKIRKALYADELEKISIRNEFTVTGSFDHRIVSGKTGAEFLHEFKKAIEEKIT